MKNILVFLFVILISFNKVITVQENLNIVIGKKLTITKIKTKRQNTMGGGINFLNFIEKERF